MTDEHLEGTNQDIEPNSEGCESCLAEGLRWVALNLCMTCGTVACCDSSPGRHATKHFHDSGHPIAGRLPKPLRWQWCYVHNAYV